ncbi:MAG: threonine ammonia-lyase [Pyrinomonadaceae bacterium]|nr:threonine ammonia-lyase [Pyrinomonadaceae bacterium]MBP9108219.1 threonine ammonia-lyase [Pyrinomonadaceae bacterium]
MTVNINDIHAARERIRDIITPTPIIADDRLSEEVGARAFLKAENLQKSGSFKIRGGYNKISQLSDDEKSRGVIAASAGNHAQGVALAAKLVGIKATIVLPELAPLTKINATRSYGADVILHGATFDEAVAHSRELQREHNYTYVHAFDDEKIIAGQGTIGLEIAECISGVSVVVVPIGGGGLISGIATAVKTLNPSARVIGVQAANVAWVNPSLKAGHAVIAESGQTIADGIAVKSPGEITLPMIQQYVDEVVEVTEEEIARAIFFCVQNNRLVVEGAGAAGLAALLAKKIIVRPEDKVCAVLCGGNIDANLLARVLEQVLVHQGRYIMLKLLVLDRPGMLATLLNKVAETRANVIEVFHRRAMWLAPLGRVGIEMLLEVRDNEHAREVEKYLEKAGYQVEREGHGDWERS